MSEGIIHDLLSGELDSKLDQIQEAIKERRKLIRATNAASSMLSLKKINGSEGVVWSKKRTRITVNMDDKEMGLIDVPAQCLKKVEVTNETIASR